MAETATQKTFQFELVSPEKILVSEQVSMVVVPGESGDFGVLAEHAPLLSSIRPGVVTVTSPEGMTTLIFVSGGFADVNGNICSVLAEEAVNVNDLDKPSLESTLKNLEDDLAFAKDDTVKSAQIRAAIGVTKAKIAAVA